LESLEKDDRMALLDAASEVLKPLEVNINKSELKRLIERQPVLKDKTAAE
jgi:hypothetical protein